MPNLNLSDGLQVLEADVERQQRRGVDLQREYARLVRLQEEREADLFLAQNADLAADASISDVNELTNGTLDSDGTSAVSDALCNGVSTDEAVTPTDPR